MTCASAAGGEGGGGGSAVERRPARRALHQTTLCRLAPPRPAPPRPAPPRPAPPRPAPPRPLPTPVRSIAGEYGAFERTGWLLRGDYDPLPPPERAQLAAIYAPFDRALELLLGCRFY